MADSNSTSKRRGAPWIVACVALVAVVLVAGYSRWAGWLGGGAMERRLGEVVHPGAADGFNVLLITLDTTRPDRLGCYGYEPARTPAIDALTERGMRFDDAVTCAPITLPSHCTIMTGKYPPNIGVRANGVYTLADEHETLAEMFKAKGYATAAFIGAFVLDARFGIAQGFDTYDFQIGRSEARRPMALENERRAADVVQSTVRWIQDQPTDKPFFVWTHFFDPHYPYESPLAGLPTFADRPYDAEIAYVDQQLARLFAALDKRGIRDRTLIVLTTDHGESLYEHDEPGHAVFVYDSTIRAALILSCPGLFDRGYVQRDRVVGTVDIVPTLADLLGLPKPTGIDGISLMSAGAKQDENAADDRAMYIESYYPQVTLACSPLVGLRTHRDKYILAPRSEYYDLQADPDERINRVDSADARARALRDRLDAVLGDWGQSVGAAPSHQLSDEDTRRLESLGYLAPSYSGAIDETCDPKDRVGLINRMSEVLDQFARQRYEQALALAEDIIKESPGWVAPVRQAAVIYVKLNRPRDAERVLSEFVSIKPDVEMMVRLAEVYITLEQWDDCEATLSAAQIIDPGLGAIPLTLGDALVAQNRYDDAKAQYERAVEIDPVRVGPEARQKLAALSNLRGK